MFGVSSQARDKAAPVAPLNIVIPDQDANAREFHFAIRFGRLKLLPGRYLLRGHVMDPEGLRVCDTLEREFCIRGESTEFGMVRLEHEWLSAADGDATRPAAVAGDRSQG